MSGQAALKGGRSLAAGCGGVKVKLDQLLDTRGQSPRGNIVCVTRSKVRLVGLTNSG